ncbi:MAG: hypothetical protein AAB131_14415 [Actinomycetota bacterium]
MRARSPEFRVPENGRGSVPYLPRLIDETLRDLLAEVPAVMLAGPHACGKTTSAQNLAASTVQLDRPDQAAAARADVDLALAVPRAEEPVLIDEWQFVPEIRSHREAQHVGPH